MDVPEIKLIIDQKDIEAAHKAQTKQAFANFKTEEQVRERQSSPVSSVSINDTMLNNAQTPALKDKGYSLIVQPPLEKLNSQPAGALTKVKSDKDDRAVSVSFAPDVSDADSSMRRVQASADDH